MQNNNIYYVYYHRSLFDGEIFYVGKGKNERVTQTIGRNLDWLNKVKEEGGFLPEIFKHNLTEEEAFKLEKEEIHRIGRDNLVNWPKPDPDANSLFIEDVILLDQKLSKNKDYSVLDSIFEVKNGSMMFLRWVNMELESNVLDFDFMEVALYFNCEVTYIKTPCIGLNVDHMYRTIILDLARK